MYDKPNIKIMNIKVKEGTSIERFVGIDVHKKQWSVSIFTSQIHHKTFSQVPETEAFKAYIDTHFSAAKVTCAFEAGNYNPMATCAW